MTDRAFWQGRRVFITGHTGFKGAWLTLLLKRFGAELSGYSLPPPTTPSLYEVAGVGDLTHSIIADIRDGGRLAVELSRAAPDIVFHLAAQPLVRRSYREPAETYTTNVDGTVNLLEAVRKVSSVRAVVVITTDKVYDLTGDTTPRRETDPLGGADPYSSSKAAAELVAASYRKSFFGPGQHPALIATARSGNVVGGGDWNEDRIVTDVVAAMHSKSHVVLRYPEAVRPWMYVLDSLIGYMVLAEHLATGEEDAASAWNFGPPANRDVQVCELVDIFANVWERRDAWRKAPGAVLPESMYLRLDPTKAVEQLGWQPAFDQAEAIREAALWYHALSTAQCDVRQLCDATMDRHLERYDRKPKENRT